MERPIYIYTYWYDVCRWAVPTELRIIWKANICLDINVGTSMCSCIAILGNVFSIENQKQDKQQILHLSTSIKHLVYIYISIQMYLNLLNPGFSSTGFPFHFSKLVFFLSFQQVSVGRAEANSEASGNRKSIVVNFICRGVEELGEFLVTVLALFATHFAGQKIGCSKNARVFPGTLIKKKIRKGT